MDFCASSPLLHAHISAPFSLWSQKSFDYFTESINFILWHFHVSSHRLRSASHPSGPHWIFQNCEWWGGHSWVLAMASLSSGKISLHCNLYHGQLPVTMFYSLLCRETKSITSPLPGQSSALFTYTVLHPVSHLDKQQVPTDIHWLAPAHPLLLWLITAEMACRLQSGSAESCIYVWS